MPGRQRPARMRRRPCSTRMRLLRSSVTTSATVPRATRSRYSARLGSGRVGGEPARRAQPGAQRHQHIEDHANPGQVLARKGTTGLIGVDDGRRRGQCVPGQVVVGDQHRDAELIGVRHPVDAGDAVVHGDQQGRVAGRRPHRRPAGSVHSHRRSGSAPDRTRPGRPGRAVRARRARCRWPRPHRNPRPPGCGPRRPGWMPAGRPPRPVRPVTHRGPGPRAPGCTRRRSGRVRYRADSAILAGWRGAAVLGRQRCDGCERESLNIDALVVGGGFRVRRRRGHPAGAQRTGTLCVDRRA